MRAPFHTPAGTPMFSDLAGCEAQLDRVNAEASRLIGDLDDERANRRPVPRQWSVAENLMHLTVTGAVYLPALDDAVLAGQSRSLYAEGPFRYRVLDRLVVWTMEPPPRVRLRTPGALAPTPARSVASVTSEFLAVQEELRARIRGANGLDLAAVKVRSPLSRLLVLSLGAAFKMLLAHERRHLWQAARARSSLEAPRPAGGRRG